MLTATPEKPRIMVVADAETRAGCLATLECAHRSFRSSSFTLSVPHRCCLVGRIGHSARAGKLTSVVCYNPLDYKAKSVEGNWKKGNLPSDFRQIF